MTNIHELPAAGLYYDLGGGYVNAKHPKFAVGGKRAIGDMKILADGVMNSGSPNFNSASAGFTAADVGKTLWVRGAAAAGLSFYTTILAFVDAANVTLSVNAGTSVTGAAALYGTDNTRILRAAIDFVAYTDTSRHGKVLLPAGLYLTTDVTHLGYGVGGVLTQVTLEGEGYVYAGTASCGGTAICPVATDRPGINIQGGRGSSVRNISVLGRLKTYLLAQGVLGATPLVDDVVSSNWDDPALGGASMDTQFAPNAGITIDAYSGVQPATHYPDRNYPAFLGAPAQYGASFSSDCLIEDVYLEGFTSLAVNQPCNADGNGDYTVLRRCYGRFAKYFMSVGNTQARATDLENCKCGFIHSVLTNNKHGKQQGKFGGMIKNLQMFDVIQMHDFGSFFAEPIVFQSPYAETMWRVGTLATAGATTELSVIILNREFKFGAQTDVRGVPSDVFNTSGVVGVDGAFVDIQVVGGHEISYPSVSPWIGQGINFEGSYFRGPARTNANEWFAHNALAGGLVTRRFQTPDRCRLKSRYYNVDTGVLTAIPEMTKRWKQGTRAQCIPFYGEEVAHLNETDVHDNGISKNPNLGGSVALTALASISLVNKTLTFTYTGRTAAQFLQRGPNTGDPILHDASGSVFFVRSVDTTTKIVIADLQNNYKSDGAGGFNPMNAFVTTAGSFYFRNARLYTTSRPIKGDFTLGSAIITNVASDDESASTIDAEINVGTPPDAIAIFDKSWGPINPANADITGRTQAGKTITVSAVTGITTRTRERLRFFIRPGPANR